MFAMIILSSGQFRNWTNHFPEYKRPQIAVSGHYLLKSGVDFLEGGVDCASGLAERGIQSGPTIER